jgi:hypothetical protein
MSRTVVLLLTYEFGPSPLDLCHRRRGWPVQVFQDVVVKGHRFRLWSSTPTACFLVERLVWLATPRRTLPETETDGWCLVPQWNRSEPNLSRR